MMFRPNPAVRWCLLSLALCLLFAAPTERRGSAALAADASATPTTPGITETSTSKPAPAVTGIPKDLNDQTREELIDLVKDLTLQNQILAVQLVEQRQALDDAAPELQARIDWQARTIKRLEAELEKAVGQAEKQAEQLKAALAEAKAKPGSDDAAKQPTAPEAEAPKTWEYRFAYEFGLIRTAGSGKLIIRDDNGKRQRHEFDYSEYRRDAIWATVHFRNDSETPKRFTGLIELQGDKPFGKSPRERLGTKVFRTPLLQPGEVFQLSEDEIATDRPWKVDIIELTEVKAFDAPAEPAPDAG
ncbi:MAG: hypothetical protein AAGA25_16380 [Planctomycetota bacterium]